MRIALSREGVYRMVGGRSLTEQRVALGAKADGQFTSIIHTGTTAMTRQNALPEPFIVATRSGYSSETFKLDVEVAYIDMLANTFMRAPGEACRHLRPGMRDRRAGRGNRMDPIELRIRNEPDKDPTEGMPFSSRNIVEGLPGWRRAVRLERGARRLVRAAKANG